MQTWNRDALEANRGKLLTTDLGIRSYIPAARHHTLYHVRDDMGMNTNIVNVTAYWLIEWLNMHDAEVLPDENDGGPLEFTIQDRYSLASDDTFNALREVGRYLSAAMYKPEATEDDVKRMQEIAARLKYTLEAIHA